MSAGIAVDARSAVGGPTTGNRFGALAGLAFSVLLFVSVAMVDIPEGANDSELVAWWSDTQNQWTVIASSYLIVIAGLCFLVFLVKLRSRLLAAEGGAGELTSLVFISGGVFVALMFTAAASRSVVGFAVRAPLDEPLPAADTLRYAPLSSYHALGVGGMLAAALAMATISALILRTGVFARWLAWLGVVAAAVVIAANALLSGPLAIPALLLWTLAVSVSLWRGGASATHVDHR